jgi:repressor LexA
MSKESDLRIEQQHKDILDFLWEYRNRHGIPPTMQEIVDRTGISSRSQVRARLRELLAADRVFWFDRNDRCFDIVNPALMIAVPIVDVIGAAPLLPTFDSDVLTSAHETVQVPRRMVGNTDGLYALEVTGDSMRDALITDGDIVVMRPAHEVRNGDLAAVLLTERNETTLKRIYREGKWLKLKPENPEMQPFYLDAAKVAIQGVVVCVIHKT